jgi:hypothetical protein
MTPKPSLPPAGVPDKGNTKYALLALLMVAGIGGLLFMRSMQNKPAPAPLPSALTMPSVAPSINAKLDDVPPPPPPDEVEEQPQQKTAVRYVAASTGCDGTCKGVYTTELEQALQVRASQARRCYNQALAQDSTLKGHVTVSVRIGPSGNMCSSAVASNDMGSPVVANCAANMFRNAQSYPAPRGGCVDAKVPISFVPQGQ